MSLIHIISNCNQKCLFCSAYLTPSEKDNNPALWRKKVLKSKDKLIQISGGEPFLCDIDELIKFAYFLKKENRIIEFQTNATLISDINLDKLKILISLINSTKGYFNVNFSSFNHKIEGLITGKKFLFAKRKGGIKILNKLGAIIRLTYVMNSFNYKYLQDFARFIIKEYKFINWIQFSFIKAIGLAKDNKSIIPEYYMVSPYLIKAMNILEKNKIYFEVDHIPLCFLGQYWQRNVDVPKIITNEKGPYLIEKKKLKSCIKCKLYKYCSGPRIDYIKLYPDSKLPIIK